VLGFELKVRPIVTPIPLLDYKLSCSGNRMLERSLSLFGKFTV
jgi:hypothetical protein